MTKQTSCVIFSHFYTVPEYSIYRYCSWYFNETQHLRFLQIVEPLGIKTDVGMMVLTDKRDINESHNKSSLQNSKNGTLNFCAVSSLRFQKAHFIHLIRCSCASNDSVYRSTLSRRHLLIHPNNSSARKQSRIQLKYTHLRMWKS